MEKKTNLILSFCFLGFIAFFALATWVFAPPEVLTDENRKVAKLPRLSRKNISTYPQSFESYFNDRFFSRSDLVKARNLLRFKCWQISDAPNILVGKNGWLYFLGETGNILTAKEQPYSQAELEQWKKALTARAKYFAQRGIRYVFVVAPNKQSIYPEYFPLFSNRKSRLDQLSAYLGQYPEVPFINLKNSLIEGKKDGASLYFKTDTHWNELGALVADRYISTLLSTSMPAIKPIALSSARLGMESFNTGDCTKLMGLFGWVQEKTPIVKIPGSKFVPEFEQGTGLATSVSRCKSNSNGTPSLPRAVVFHDSFGAAIKPYLAQHFSRAAYQLRQADLAVDLDLIEKEKPEIVIQEVVERHVVQMIPYEVMDWRYRILDAIKAGEKNSEDQQRTPNLDSDTASSKTQWLSVLPCTNEVNSARLQEVLRSPHSMVTATTARQWTDAGVVVNFDPKTTGYFDWYVTKSGAQDKSIGDSKITSPESQLAFQRLSEYVQKGGQFKPMKKVELFDGSVITLWHKSESSLNANSGGLCPKL